MQEQAQDQGLLFAVKTAFAQKQQAKRAGTNKRKDPDLLVRWIQYFSRGTRARNVFELLFYQPISFRFVHHLTKMAEAEGSFEERFPEMMRQFPIIYDNSSFSLNIRSLHLFLRLLLRRY